MNVLVMNVSTTTSIDNHVVAMGVMRGISD